MTRRLVCVSIQSRFMITARDDSITLTYVKPSMMRGDHSFDFILTKDESIRQLALSTVLAAIETSAAERELLIAASNLDIYIMKASSGFIGMVSQKVEGHEGMVVFSYDPLNPTTVFIFPFIYKSEDDLSIMPGLLLGGDDADQDGNLKRLGQIVRDTIALRHAETGKCDKEVDLSQRFSFLSWKCDDLKSLMERTDRVRKSTRRTDFTHDSNDQLFTRHLTEYLTLNLNVFSLESLGLPDGVTPIEVYLVPALEHICQKRTVVVEYFHKLHNIGLVNVEVVDVSSDECKLHYGESSDNPLFVDDTYNKFMSRTKGLRKAFNDIWRAFKWNLSTLIQSATDLTALRKRMVAHIKALRAEYDKEVSDTVSTSSLVSKMHSLAAEPCVTQSRDVSSSMGKLIADTWSVGLNSTTAEPSFDRALLQETVELYINDKWEQATAAAEMSARFVHFVEKLTKNKEKEREIGKLIADDSEYVSDGNMYEKSSIQLWKLAHQRTLDVVAETSGYKVVDGNIPDFDEDVPNMRGVLSGLLVWSTRLVGAHIKSDKNLTELIKDITVKGIVYHERDERRMFRFIVVNLVVLADVRNDFLTNLGNLKTRFLRPDEALPRVMENMDDVLKGAGPAAAIMGDVAANCCRLWKMKLALLEIKQHGKDTPATDKAYALVAAKESVVSGSFIDDVFADQGPLMNGFKKEDGLNAVVESLSVGAAKTLLKEKLRWRLVMELANIKSKLSNESLLALVTRCVENHACSDIQFGQLWKWGNNIV
eukprot:GHVS01007907.1.p1 GENE.GHVS01007907.1~~GHVS01007907.1.p1  ORF type:complete len:765 (-),score=74.93 GHVS01007907.1:72-2366(-)